MSLFEAQLRRSAAEARCSRNSEVLHRLEDGLGPQRLDAEDLLARARTVRRTLRRPVTESDLRRARSTGRP